MITCRQRHGRARTSVTVATGWAYFACIRNKTQNNNKGSKHIKPTTAATGSANCTLGDRPARCATSLTKGTTHGSAIWSRAQQPKNYVMLLTGIFRGPLFGAPSLFGLIHISILLKGNSHTPFSARAQPSGLNPRATGDPRPACLGESVGKVAPARPPACTPARHPPARL